MSDERVPRPANLHETSGSPDPDSVQRIREDVEAAKDAGPDYRVEHIKSALGETIGLKVAGVMNAPDIEENLTAILTRPDEEAAFFANQALQELERVEEEVEGDAGTDEDAGQDAPLDADTDEDEPPECVRWTGPDTGVIEIETTRPFIEWLALEVDEHGLESLAWYITLVLQDHLENDLVTKHRFDAPVEVDVPEDVAQRLALKHQDLKAQGIERDPKDLVLNYSAYDLSFRLNGEPWALTGGGGRNGGETDG